MKILLIVFGGVLVLAIVFGMLDWYYWGRSPKARYQSTRIHISSKPSTYGKTIREPPEKKPNKQGTHISPHHAH